MTYLIKKQKNAIRISLVIVFSSLVAIGTLIIRIPNPMGGYFNVGDVMIFVTALTFNPIIGGLASGLGSAVADIIGGFPTFVIPTLVIKGLEGFIASFLKTKKNIFRDFLAVFVAGIEMIAGYFIVEYFLWGYGGALAEIPTNIAQIVIGGLLGIPIAIILRNRLPNIILE